MSFPVTDTISCASTPRISWVTLTMQNNEALNSTCGRIRVTASTAGTFDNLEFTLHWRLVLNPLRVSGRFLLASVLLGMYPWQSFTSLFRKQNKLHCHDTAERNLVLRLEIIQFVWNCIIKLYKPIGIDWWHWLLMSWFELSGNR